MPQLPDVPLGGLYGDAILDHYRSPRHRVSVPDADVEAEEYNPFCGDRVALRLKLDDNGCVVQVGAHSEGCSIIQATASMMADALQGKDLSESVDLARLFHDMMRGRPLPAGWEDHLGQLKALTVVRRFPVRIKCALLPWTALEVAIESYRSSHTRDQ